MSTSRLLMVSALLICLANGQAHADSVIAGGGGATTFLNFPFGGTNTYQGEYQQIYSSSVFSGPFAISSVAFQSITTPASGGSGTSGTVDVSLSLSTTGASVDAPSTTYADNRGADFTTVFSGSITYTAVNGTFDLVFPTTAFTFNPSQGNLLVDLDIISASTVGGNVPFLGGVGPSSPAVSRVYTFGGTQGTTVMTDTLTLLTEFNGAAVPEPSSMVLGGIAVAIGLVVGKLRSSRVARS